MALTRTAQLWALSLLASQGVTTADAAFVPGTSVASFAGSKSGPSSAVTISGAPRVAAAAEVRRPTFLSAESEDDDAASSSGGGGGGETLPPIPNEWRGDILSVLSSVVDPDLNRDIVTLGFIKNLELNEHTRAVSFDVELTTPACPVKDQFEIDCRALVEDLAWTGDVDVTMTAAPSNIDTDSLGLSQVGAVIAVSSCKGGVGKSTTAVNLAYSLQSLGASVGIFDVDVYGPSLPTMVTPDDDNVQFVGRQIAPLQRNGVKLMSFGYVNEGSAVMRGPMVTQLLDQFLSLVNWGSLDYLILDMPPGTGDIQLTLSQRLNITAAVIVTTPQELSFADVVRGIDMFDSVNVPCVAVVENMAYYEVDSNGANGEKAKPELDIERLKRKMEAKLRDTGVVDGDFGLQVDELAESLVEVVEKEQLRSAEEASSDDADDDASPTKERIQIFGPGHKSRLSDQYGIEHTYSVPLLDRIAANGDSGDPFVLSHPDAPQSSTYRELASSVVREVGKVKYNRDSSRPVVAFDSAKPAVVVDGRDISPATLRRACRCAYCVEELTGRQLLDPATISESVRPLKMEPCGNYALSVDWSDGHKSLYPYRQIRSLLEDMGEGEGTTTTTTKERESTMEEKVGV
uniref:MIP18 family-like domain-containing protein n=1 Tax=Odontella aurita TaxID=265563 RepID=A0A7S4MSW4_9STRA|mmetsp:Transcript_31013/g.92980  ORF Transcript_31013/g.92980 Transcript_31013/m.92980 type:complete len:630 (+) Transcript_31013:54-1943(+)